jgi:trypsin
MKAATLLLAFVALIDGQERILGGNEAAVGQHRYVAQLISCNGPNPSNCHCFCAGSLIAPNAVLTAAHCISSQTPISWVVLGSHFLKAPNNDMTANGVQVEVRQVIRHPRYNSQLSSDAAILLLKENITTIEPVQVSFTQVPKDIWTVARGWGHTTFNGIVSNVLMEVALKTWSNREAAMIYSKYVPIPIDATMLAARGGRGKATCQGDSGGPLTIESTGSRAKLVGLTSWGYECGILPGIYSRISAFRDFITQYCKESTEKRIPCTDCVFAGCG